MDNGKALKAYKNSHEAQKKYWDTVSKIARKVFNPLAELPEGFLTADSLKVPYFLCKLLKLLKYFLVYNFPQKYFRLSIHSQRYYAIECRTRYF